MIEAICRLALLPADQLPNDDAYSWLLPEDDPILIEEEEEEV